MTVALLAASFSLILSAGDSSGIFPAADLLPDTIVSRESYAGAGLTGYINGGAEIFREFGFDELTVVDIRGREGTGTIEAYRMSDPVAAVGIFSQSHPGCQHHDSLTYFSCVTPRQRALVRGTWYLRIVSTGSAPSQTLLDRLAAVARRLFPEKRPDLPAAMMHPVLAPRLHELVIARGSLGLQSMGPLLAWLVDEVLPVELYSIPYGEGDAQSEVVLIRTSEARALERIHHRAKGEPRIHLLSAGETRGETLLVITPGSGAVPESLRLLTRPGQR